MKKSSIVLFSARLFLYFSVIGLIFVHPGIAITFDRIGIVQWFFMIPLMAMIAFIPEHVLKIQIRRILLFVISAVLALIAGISFSGVIQLSAAGFISYLLTFLLFNSSMLYAKFAKVTALEPFFLAWVCLRLLSLSRSGEDIAGQSVALTQFIFIWTAAVFLLHSAVIYFCLYPKSRINLWKEVIVFSLSALAVLFVVFVVLPPDFVRNAVISNLLSERVPERIRPSDTDRGLPQRGGGRRTLPRGEGSGQPGLRGLSEYNWPDRGGSSDDNRQYMVKIVASQKEPVYMGNVFRGQLDPVKGFLLSSGEHLNDLASQRFFVTWFDNEREQDIGRERHEVFSLSTLRHKYLPYRPVVIDPVILSENAGPLRFIHQVVSNTHVDDPLQLVNTPSRPLSVREGSALAHYLELPPGIDGIEEFTAYLDSALESWQKNRGEIIRNDNYLREIFSVSRNLIADTDTLPVNNEYMEIIIALLVSFSQYQYNLNPDDDYSIAALKDFILNSQEGDCVEFSNTLALLGRLAGIPSRVVTGYLAAEGLQTIAHLRGIAALRSRIPALQQFPFDNLFMVTNIHSHSWTQFYIPDYGWLDFEATAFSQPPVGMGDFNNWDVVIPLLDENRVFSQVRKFPWQAVGRAILTLVIAAVICAYALRYGRELALYIGAKRGGRQGTRSLYLLLLARLAADGQPIKPASKTAHEYSQLFSNNISQRRGDAEGTKEEDTRFKTFADIYSAMRWREFSSEAEANERFLQLREEYFNILKNTRRRGIHRWFIRLISLRGLAYL